MSLSVNIYLMVNKDVEKEKSDISFFYVIVMFLFVSYSSKHI